MSEATETTKPPHVLLDEWLKDRHLTLQIVVLAPYGGVVHPRNFLPEGWRLQAQPVPEEPNGPPQ